LANKVFTAEAARKAFRDGFEVFDPSREPRLTVSKIVKSLLGNPKVAVL
jgi:hypothetical protein